MKKFAEYITEGAPEGKKPKEVLDDEKSKIAEERLRLIDESIGGRIGGFFSGIMGGVRSGKVTTPKLGKMSRVKKPSSRLRDLRSRNAGRRAGQKFGLSIRRRVGDLTTGLKKGFTDALVNRTTGAIQRRLDRAFDPGGLKSGRGTQYTQMTGADKLQSGSIGSARADAERRRRELGL